MIMDFKKLKILLGSGSPRRKLLLQELGFSFRILTSKTAEIPLPHLKGGEIALYLAEEKADALLNELHEGEILITADTIVWLESTMLGKPLHAEEAFQMIKKLSGRKHEVYTGVCVCNRNKRELFCVNSEVVFKELSEIDIKHYVKAYHPMDKAGSYGAQECLPEGMNPCSEEEKLFLKKFGKEDICERSMAEIKTKRIPFIDHIEGSYFNVMGLPIVELTNVLEKF